MDWNIFIVPQKESPYDRRFALAKLLMDLSGNLPELTSCVGPHDCFEAELTAHERLRDRRVDADWISLAAVVGRPICAFGPWVADSEHGHKPEIHPAERLWWWSPDAQRQASAPGRAAPDDATSEALYLAVVQDASQRFRQLPHFASTRTPVKGPEKTRRLPWASATSLEQARALIAFSLSRDKPNATFRIEVFDNQAQPPYPSCDRRAGTFVQMVSVPGSDLKFKITTDVLASRASETFDQKTLGLRIESPCWDDEKKILRGYLSLRSKVGCEHCTEEGYQVLKVSVSPPDAVNRDSISYAGQAAVRPAAPGRPASVLTSVLLERSDFAEVKPRKSIAPELRMALAKIRPRLRPRLGPDLSTAEKTGRLRRTTRWELGVAPRYRGPGRRTERLNKELEKAETDKKTGAYLSFLHTLCERPPDPQLPRPNLCDWLKNNPGTLPGTDPYDPFEFDWNWDRVAYDLTENGRPIEFCSVDPSDPSRQSIGCPTQSGAPFVFVKLDHPRRKVILLPSDRENPSHDVEYEDHVYLVDVKEAARYRQTKGPGLNCWVASGTGITEGDWHCEEKRDVWLLSHYLAPPSQKEIGRWLEGFFVQSNAPESDRASEDKELVLQGMAQFGFLEPKRMTAKALSTFLFAWSLAREGKLDATALLEKDSAKAPPGFLPNVLTSQAR